MIKINRSGQIRKLDKLGRVSVPAEIRKQLSILEGDMVEFSVNGAKIVIERYDTVCMVCGSSKGVKRLSMKTQSGEDKDFNLCRSCLIEIEQKMRGDS